MYSTGRRFSGKFRRGNLQWPGGGPQPTIAEDVVYITLAGFIILKHVERKWRNKYAYAGFFPAAQFGFLRHPHGRSFPPKSWGHTAAGHCRISELTQEELSQDEFGHATAPLLCCSSLFMYYWDLSRPFGGTPCCHTRSHSCTNAGCLLDSLFKVSGGWRKCSVKNVLWVFFSSPAWKRKWWVSERDSKWGFKIGKSYFICVGGALIWFLAFMCIIICKRGDCPLCVCEEDFFSPF